MAPLTLRSTVALPNNEKLPQLGFGVWDSPSDLTTQSCLSALKAGYRHIDTAQVYGNETEVGEAVKQSGLPREEIFITSKILGPGDDAEETYQKCLSSVQKIAGDDGYLDLFLIHNVTSGAKGVKLLWQAMEKLQSEGKIKSIGVSNAGIGMIEGMKSYAKAWPPAVNQFELHPWCQQREIVSYCQKNGIAVEAYCPLVRNQKAEDPELKGIADAHEKSTAQVLLRYCLQKGWVPLPKSDNAGRIGQNADLYDFELSKEELENLDAKDQGEKGALVMVVDNEKTT
ncbi:probable aldo-keto reductase [Ramularia collo-cygni]|uniref:Probable aldo-keto reductase n=1 Tax=Ramularia collo-cygni TaxID=112498 RepID=A0A2D3UXS6_9PEZI|nr:probable aldo-keto reductase [Ramularia collo-cygni]CZT17980.1 probable aldo-keto reductase [Ramularia collo-cygni]